MIVIRNICIKIFHYFTYFTINKLKSNLYHQHKVLLAFFHFLKIKNFIKNFSQRMITKSGFDSLTSSTSLLVSIKRKASC